MADQTQSEALFEEFCRVNNLICERVPVSSIKTPDYYLRFGSKIVAVEVEQIEKLDGFNPSGVSSRTVGSHVRSKISEARKQIQTSAKSGLPTILLIYNSVDPLFGVEPHDFLSAMYGELTVTISDGKMGKPFHGRNPRLRRETNTSFSGVGHLWRRAKRIHVTVYENIYARISLPFAELPSSIEVVRVEVEKG